MNLRGGGEKAVEYTITDRTIQTTECWNDGINWRLKVRCGNGKVIDTKRRIQLLEDYTILMK